MKETMHAKNVLRLHFTGNGITVEDEKAKMLQEGHRA